MNLPLNQFVAVGVDFEPSGNEHRLQFAPPVVVGEEDRLAIAESWKSRADLTFVSLAEIENAVALFNKPIVVHPPQGLLILGTKYAEMAIALDDPMITTTLVQCQQLMSRIGAILVDGGHWCIPATQDEFKTVARAFAAQAKRSFDLALEGSREVMDGKAKKALRLFEAEPLLSYDDRLFRRLLYLRASRKTDGYLAALEIGSRRLGLPEKAIEAKVIRALEVLWEKWPFERAINARAKELWSQEVNRVNIDFAAGERLRLDQLEPPMRVHTISEDEPQGAWVNLFSESHVDPGLAQVAQAIRVAGTPDIEEGDPNE